MTGGRTPVDRLGQPALAPLVDELVRRFEATGSAVRITVPPLGDGEPVLADLLGLDRHLGTGRTSRSITVTRLADAIGGDVRATVERLRGPLADRRAERSDAADRRAELWAWLSDAAADCGFFGRRPDVAGDLATGTGSSAADRRVHAWVERVRFVGVPDGDVDRHRQRLERAVSLLHRLPVSPTPLASLAADTTGDAHGLDPGRRINRLVLDALAIAVDEPGTEPTHHPATDASGIAEERALWARFGVFADQLSSTVLTLGLRSVTDDPLGRLLAIAADEGEPIVLTLAQLTRWGLEPPAGLSTVHVVENPTIIAEAAKARVDTPLICTAGWPSAAAQKVIGAAIDVGATVRQHADFDPPGCKIVAWCAQHHGTTPWRMTAADYRYGLAIAPPGPRITVDVPPTPWDPDLADAMVEVRHAVHEETVRASMIEAMQAGSRRS